MGDISTAAELFNSVVQRVGVINSSFNKQSFPTTTEKILGEILRFIDHNTPILRASNPLERQFLDALIELRQSLQKYRENPAVRDDFEQRDFVEARKSFKNVIEQKFYKLLMPNEAGKPSPSTVWKKSTKILEKIIGL